MFEGLLQPTHILLILAIAMLFFGGKKLPELGKGLGEAIRGFKGAMREVEAPPQNSTPAPPAIDVRPTKPVS